MHGVQLIRIPNTKFDRHLFRQHVKWILMYINRGLSLENKYAY